jgi:hypothetical protein
MKVTTELILYTGLHLTYSLRCKVFSYFKREADNLCVFCISATRLFRFGQYNHTNIHITSTMCSLINSTVQSFLSKVDTYSVKKLPAFMQPAESPYSQNFVIGPYTKTIPSRGSSGSIVSDYGLDDRAIEVRSLTEAEDFSSSPCVQTGSGAHPASNPMSIGGSFAGGKARPRRDADHSPPSRAEVKNE